MKRVLSLLMSVVIAATMVSGSIASASAQSATPNTITDPMWTEFQTPSRESKSRPLWFWNDRLGNTNTDKINEIMQKSNDESGYYGFGILPNWIDGYMSEEYLNLYGDALKKAKELDMKMCLYDENGFPSGAAGGILASKYPEHTAKRLDKFETEVAGGQTVHMNIPDGTVSGAVAMNTETNELIDITDKINYVGGDKPGVYASSSHPDIAPNSYGVAQAFDGDYNTRWNSATGASSNQWLEVNYGTPTAVNKIVLRESLDRITSFAVQYYDGAEWIDIQIGTTIGALKTIEFDTVTASKFRLLQKTVDDKPTSTSVSIYEMELFNNDTKLNTPQPVYDSLDYDVPEGGNWKIMIFAVVKDGWNKVDYLSEAAVDKFIEVTHQVYYDRFSEYFGTVIDSSFYDEPTFWTVQGGRTWTEEFNTLFEEKYGFDPIKYYPALWYDIGEDTEAARTALFGFRAELFSTSFVKNLNDWCTDHGIELTGHMDQEEVVNPTSLSGDLMKMFEYQDMPGLDSIAAYDRGQKMYKIVSSAANNYDKPKVMTEIYGAMGEGMGVPTMYKDVMDQYAKGVNVIVPHAIWYNNLTTGAPPELSYRSAQYGPELPTYNNYVGRTSGILQQGRHVADIGVLYPIDTLQAGYRFGPENPYTGGITPEEADYMEVGELLSTTIRKDFTYLHPEVLTENCSVDGATLKLNNKNNFEEYSVFVMPGSKTISLDALKQIKAFYDNGGKVIATTQLPYMSAEFGKNQEVVDIIEEMFGVDPTPQPELMKYDASSIFNNDYSAAKAFDGVYGNGSRWNAGDLSGGDEWLEVDFGKEVTLNRTVITENVPNFRTTKYRIQAWNGTAWEDCVTGTSIGDHKEDQFADVTTTKLRLYIDTIKSDSVSIEEFEIYYNDSENLAIPTSEQAYTTHTNDKDGAAYFVENNVSAHLNEVLNKAQPVYDVTFDDGITTSGGHLSYIHKTIDDKQAYFIANSSNNAIDTYVNIRGEITPMIWNPHTGTKSAPEYSHIQQNGQTVTRVKLNMTPVQSLFIMDETAPVIVETNKKILSFVIDYAQKAIDDKRVDALIPTAQINFMSAFENATKVFHNTAATQEQVDQAWVLLMDAIHTLSFVSGDKTDLNMLIQMCDLYDINDIDGDTTAFTSALAAAKAVSADPDAMDNDIKTVYDALNEAVKALVFKDRTQLEAVVAYADGRMQIIDLFQDGQAKTTFIAALAAAKAVLADKTSTQAQIDATTQALTEATANLRFIADKATLEKVLKDAKSIDVSVYTAASVSALEDAIKAGQKVFDDPNATKEQIDAAEEKINTAKAGLIVKDTTPETTPVDKTEATADGANGTTNSATTGDTFPALALTTALMLAAVAFVATKKRNHNK